MEELRALPRYRRLTDNEATERLGEAATDDVRAMNLIQVRRRSRILPDSGTDCGNTFATVPPPVESPCHPYSEVATFHRSEWVGEASLQSVSLC